MSFKNISNQALHEKLQTLSSEERRITLEVLHHLKEAEARRLFAEKGYPSLFEYVVKELQYSEPTAQRRIAAMRALRDVPEIEEKIRAGELKITQVAQIQSFFRAEKKEGKIYTQEQKCELFQETLGKSTRETEKLLLEKSPSYALHAGSLQDRVREVTPTLTQVTFTADEALMQRLKEVRDRYAQQLPEAATPGEVIRFMAEFVLKNDRMLRTTRKEKVVSKRDHENPRSENSKGVSTETTIGVEATRLGAKLLYAGRAVAALKVKGACKTEDAFTTNEMRNPRRTVQAIARYIPRPIQRIVWRRDYPEGCAMIRHGKRCGSKHRLQIDHIQPFALGGSSTDSESLRLTCFHHNQWAAQVMFGPRRSLRP